MDETNGSITIYASENNVHTTSEEPYEGKLVVTVHCCKQHDNDPYWSDTIARKLERFMRDHDISRLEAYWNAIPPEK